MLDFQHGRLKVVKYKGKTIKVKLVPVNCDAKNNQTIFALLSQTQIMRDSLNLIYQSANVQWEVSLDATLDIPQLAAGINDADDKILSAHSNDRHYPKETLNV